MDRQTLIEYLYFLYSSYSDIDFKENGINEFSNIDLFQLDSVDYIKIILEIEEKYSFEFNNEELTLNNITCINDMCDFILKHTENAGI